MEIAALPPDSASLFSSVLKIVILQDQLRSGGTERQSIVLTKGLLANGLDAQLVTFRPGGALAASAQGLPGGALQAPDRGLDWHTPGLRRKIRREQPDAILAMGRMANCRLGWLNAGPARTIATFRTGKPLPWLYQRALRRADRVVANSAEGAQNLTTLYRIPAKKISVIYNGLVFPSGPADPGTLRSRFGANPATTVFVCVAMFRPEKQHRELVETFASLQPDWNWQLWLTGDGPTRTAVERQAENLGLQKHVKFLGFQPDPSAVYAAASVAVHASESESLSNFLIEAQAHGLPILAYAAQGIAECMVPGHTGWIISRGDRTAFRAAAIRLMHAPERERAKVAAAAAQFARERFDAERQIAAYVGLLRRLQSGASS